MTTVHEELAHAVLAETLASPDGPGALQQARDRIRARHTDPRYVSWIGQSQKDPHYWPPHQMAAYLRVHEMLATGEAVMFLVKAGAEPGPDADRDGNAAKLAQLPRPYTAALDMEQHGADSDGSLTWSAAVTAWRSTGLLLHASHTVTPVDIATRAEPRTVPLEVGSSLPSRTLMHLLVERSVARWAYGDKRVCVILNTATGGIGL